MTKILSNADLIARHSTTGSRITLKIGSALLIDPETGQLRKAWLKSIARDVVFLRQKGYQVIIVSSGAIGLGRKILNLPPSRKLEDSQAAAAVGQIELATAYRSILGDLDIPMAQVLLTYGDTEERRRYLNARTTINRLLELGVVPVINENDTVATDEVRYGDNDRLAARVASMCEADCLFLLSDIDGLYSANPHKDPAARFIATVETVTPEIEAMAGAPISTGFGTGGMVTKIAAAKIASASGCHMVITNGTVEAPIQAWHDGARGTWFQGSGSPLAAKKKWIGASLDIAGSLIIDAGAVKALHSGKSLLPAGIVRIEGQFERGDILQVIAIDGTLIGQGLTAYGSHEAVKLIGHRSHEIEQILGYTGRNEMIHRNDLVTP